MDLLHRFCSSQFEASSWVCVCYDVFAHFNVKKSQWLSQTQGCEICHPHLTHHPLKERWAAAVLRLGSIGWSNQCQAGRQWGPLLHSFYHWTAELRFQLMWLMRYDCSAYCSRHQVWMCCAGNLLGFLELPYVPRTLCDIFWMYSNDLAEGRCTKKQLSRDL